MSGITMTRLYSLVVHVIGA